MFDTASLLKICSFSGRHCLFPCVYIYADYWVNDVNTDLTCSTAALLFPCFINMCSLVLASVTLLLIFFSFLAQPLIKHNCQTHIFNDTIQTHQIMNQEDRLKKFLGIRFASSTLENHALRILRDNDILHEKHLFCRNSL